ncbi:DUF3703 domain-containing protein [Hydrogenophaga sp.]|jgi:hypothetical protein|uniref:DUF3703 domain-containing protein n=1 Tax=Hydrogenophaga sp. TaxID=1904254 RepID=UPI0025B97E40|nr:DUF3703 domain-containing protein [Hydrogenophaga sp.]
MATPTDTERPGDPRLDRRTYTTLIAHAMESPSAGQTWLWLEAAHVVGQRHLVPHLQTHWLMLRLALRTRDWPEAAGQAFRLALVPLGHLSGRLPLGNPGRSTASAFAPMPVRPELLELIRQARGA